MIAPTAMRIASPRSDVPSATFLFATSGLASTGVVGSGSDAGVRGSSPIHGVEGNGFTSGKGVFGQSSIGTGVFG